MGINCSNKGPQVLSFKYPGWNYKSVDFLPSSEVFPSVPYKTPGCFSSDYSNDSIKALHNLGDKAPSLR